MKTDTWASSENDVEFEEVKGGLFSKPNPFASSSKPNPCASSEDDRSVKELNEERVPRDESEEHEDADRLLMVLLACCARAS